MATYTKFQPFVEHLAEGVHNLGSDQLAAHFCAAANAPTATDGVLGDLTTVTVTNLSSRNITTSASAQTGGTYKLTLADLTVTATGGNVGPLRYVVIYNDAATGDNLIAYFDYGSEITLSTGETLQLDFDASNGLLQIA